MSNSTSPHLTTQDEVTEAMLEQQWNAISAHYGQPDYHRTGKILKCAVCHCDLSIGQRVRLSADKKTAIHDRHQACITYAIHGGPRVYAVTYHYPGMLKPDFDIIAATPDDIQERYARLAQTGNYTEDFRVREAGDVYQCACCAHALYFGDRILRSANRNHKKSLVPSAQIEQALHRFSSDCVNAIRNDQTASRKQAAKTNKNEIYRQWKAIKIAGGYSLDIRKLATSASCECCGQAIEPGSMVIRNEAGLYIHFYASHCADDRIGGRLKDWSPPMGKVWDTKPAPAIASRKPKQGLPTEAINMTADPHMLKSKRAIAETKPAKNAEVVEPIPPTRALVLVGYTDPLTRTQKPPIYQPPPQPLCLPAPTPATDRQKRLVEQAAVGQISESDLFRSWFDEALAPLVGGRRFNDLLLVDLDIVLSAIKAVEVQLVDSAVVKKHKKQSRLYGPEYDRHAFKKCVSASGGRTHKISRLTTAEFALLAAELDEIDTTPAYSKVG